MLNLEDPFVRRLAKFATLIVAVLLALPAVLGLAIALDYTFWPEHIGHDTLVAIFRFVPDPKSSKVQEVLSLLQIFIAALPAALLGVALEKKDTPDAARRFNRFGRIVFWVFLAAVACGIVAYLLIDPESWATNHQLGRAGLQRLVEIIRASLQAGAFYLALLLGLKAIK